MRKGTLFVISAPSGAGKSTLIERIRPRFPDVAYSISCTTRAPRGSEQDGVHYHFVSREQFKSMIEHDEFLEWKEVHGNLYGTPAGPVRDVIEKGGCMILDIDVQGAREVFKNADSAVGIFINAPDLETLVERLQRRGTDTEESIATRMGNARLEIAARDLFRHQIMNDDLEKATEKLASIIRTELESH
jgi:guanylate kinase